MKRILFVAIAIALWPVSAFAGSSSPPPLFNWTGFYAGMNGGYAWQSSTIDVAGVDPLAVVVTCGGFSGGTCLPSSSLSARGGFGGFQFGYNHQLSPNFLMGVESDFDWSHLQANGGGNFHIANAPSDYTASDKVDWFGTLRGRFGFLPTDRLLVYGTAGFAYGHVAQDVAIHTPPGASFGFSGSGFILACNGVASTTCFAGNDNRIATGWTAGGGFEFAAWNNVTIKAEYIYMDLGSHSIAALTRFSSTSSFHAAYGETDLQLARIALNYLFSTR